MGVALHPRILLIASAVFLLTACCLLDALTVDRASLNSSAVGTPMPRIPKLLANGLKSRFTSNSTSAMLSNGTNLFSDMRSRTDSRLEAAKARIQGTLQAFQSTSSPPQHPLVECADRDSNCQTWATNGECQANPGFMRPNCPRACNACDLFVKGQRLCHRTMADLPLLRAGGVDATFKQLVAMFEATHEVKVLLRPPAGPWVVIIENFLAEHEVRALIEKGGHHFERSLAGDGVTPVRTSETSWCNVPYCEQDPTIQHVRARIANATGVPISHGEHIQVLRYRVGQFYREHHDQNALSRSPWGPRLFTFFLYLTDVAEGGGTRFTHLNLTVSPKRGRALMWPSVLDSDPSAIRGADSRTMHESMTVVAGEKLAANVWLHQYDFQRALLAGCKNEDAAVCGDCVQATDATLSSRA